MRNDRDRRDVEARRGVAMVLGGLAILGALTKGAPVILLFAGIMASVGAWVHYSSRLSSIRARHREADSFLANFNLELATSLPATGPPNGVPDGSMVQFEAGKLVVQWTSGEIVNVFDDDLYRDEA